jgi:hypothetical protein
MERLDDVSTSLVTGAVPPRREAAISAKFDDVIATVFLLPVPKRDADWLIVTEV